MVSAPSSRPPRAPPASTSPPTERQAYHEQYGRPARFVPTDKFFTAFNEARERDAPAQELRCIAMQQVQPARVPEEDKIVLWIPAPQIARVYGTPEVMDSINREAQSQTWASVSSSVCAIEVVKNRGIRITCTNRDLAIKLGGTAITCMGQKLIVKPYSAYDRFYYVDLTHIPAGLSDDEIYDYFAGLGLQPIIAPTHVVGPLMSRDRTVWFPQHDVPDALLTDGIPLREIKFPASDFPVFVQHKKRSLNKVVPPSIAAKRAAAAAATTPRAAPREPGVRRVARRENPAESSGHQGPTSQSHKSVPNASSLPPMTSSCPDGDIILERPDASDPAEAWVKITRHALCSRAPAPTATTRVQVSSTQDSDGRLVFGFPVKPTGFELAFCEHDLDEPTAGDADCDVFADATVISGSPMEFKRPVGDLVVNHSFLKPKTNALKRSEYRRRAKKAAKDLSTMLEPDDRLAAMTAQPGAYAPIVLASPPEMHSLADEHALLRLYSGKPSSTHGTDCSFAKRLAKDYSDDEAPTAEIILLEQLPDDSDRDAARAYAQMDLFFRTHAPAIYHDPLKIQALCGDVSITSHQYSNFLLWSDRTLAYLCRSELGQQYEQYLSEPLARALQLVLDDWPTGNASISMASSTHENDESESVTPSDDESMGSSESPEAPHL